MCDFFCRDGTLNARAKWRKNGIIELGVEYTFCKFHWEYDIYWSPTGRHCREVSKSLATLTLGSSKINQHCWRFHGSGVIAAPQIIGLISFCTGMHHEYFFEVVNVLSCSPFMFENTENKQLDWRIRHSHLASTLFHSLVPWWRPRRIRPQITRLSQLENSAMGRGQFTRTLLYQTGSKNGVI